MTKPRISLDQALFVAFRVGFLMARDHYGAMLDEIDHDAIAAKVVDAKWKDGGAREVEEVFQKINEESK